MKRCNSCKKVKQFSAFSRNGRRWRSHCKQCTSEYHVKYRKKVGKDTFKDRQLRHLYGITLSEYNSLVDACKGLCAVCKASKQLHVDHDHGTGLVRGLLCENCNRGLGMFSDNIELLYSAIEYLATH